MADILSFPKYNAATPVFIMAYKGDDFRSETCALIDYRNTLLKLVREFSYDKADILDCSDLNLLISETPGATEFYDKDVENLFLSLHKDSYVLVEGHEDLDYWDYPTWSETCTLKESYNVIRNRIQTRRTDPDIVTTNYFYVIWDADVIYTYYQGEIIFDPKYENCKKYVRMPKR